MRYNDCDWFDYNDVSICNDVDDASPCRMWIDDKDVDDWDVCEANSFSKLSIFIKTRISDLTNWISSFTFIFFINKNDSEAKDEGENINFSAMKWWEAFTRLTKIKLKKKPFFS